MVSQLAEPARSCGGLAGAQLIVLPVLMARFPA
jgi:hypothetical protein